MYSNVQSRSSTRRLAVFLVILAVVLASGAIAYYAFTTLSGNDMPSPSELYASVTGSPPLLKDALSGSYTGNWETYSKGKASCTLKNGALHTFMDAENPLTDNFIDTLVACSLRNTTFSNFALQVHMNVLQGDETWAGIFFRSDAQIAHTYRFYLDFYGNYNFVTENHNEPVGTNLAVFMPGIKENRSHTLTVIAQGTAIYLYIDGKSVNTITDPSYLSGEIGFFTTRNDLATTDVAFSNVEIWKL